MLGYRLKSCRYEIVPEEAELVRRIYDFVNDGVIVRSHQTVSPFGWGGSIEPPTPRIC